MDGERLMKRLRTTLVLLFYSLWLAFYGKLLLAGEIRYYLNPSLNIFSWVLFLLLFIFFLTHLWLALQGVALKLKKRYILYLLPLAAVLLMEPATLGTDMLKKKEAARQDRVQSIDQAFREYQGKEHSLTEEPYNGTVHYKVYTPDDFLQHLDTVYYNWPTFLGKVYGIRGLYHVDQMICRENQAMVSRYMVTCCVADAILKGFIIEFETRPPIKEGEWIEVTGVLEKGKSRINETPFFRVLHIRGITKLHPYVYP